MKITNTTRVRVVLEFEDEQFTAADDYSEDRVEVRAKELDIRGTSIWATGPMRKSDGRWGTAKRSVLIEAKDVPHEVLATMFEELLHQG